MRQSWDDYFMSIAHLVKSRSTCIRRQVGAVAVSKEHRILGTGSVSYTHLDVYKRQVPMR